MFIPNSARNGWPRSEGLVGSWLRGHSFKSGGGGGGGGGGGRTRKATIFSAFHNSPVLQKLNHVVSPPPPPPPHTHISKWICAPAHRYDQSSSRPIIHGKGLGKLRQHVHNFWLEISVKNKFMLKNTTGLHKTTVDVAIHFTHFLAKFRISELK